MSWKPLVIILVILITSLGLIIYNSNTNDKALVFKILPDKDLLRKFLESQYIEEAGLLRASVYPTTDDSYKIFVANDNVLGARALAVLGSPLADDVLTTLNNVYQGGFNGRIEILLGIDIEGKFYEPYFIELGTVYSSKLGFNLTIYKEVYNENKEMTNWYKYADLVVYRGLDSLLEGSRSEAERWFINMTKSWNGYGFYDEFVKNNEEKYGKKLYQVYKCALFVYFYRALYYANSDIIRDYNHILSKCLEIIVMAQDSEYGSIHTDYEVRNGEIVITGDMNVETTSIVVLALYSNYPEMIGKRMIK